VLALLLLSELERVEWMRSMELADW